uniref:NB-ARC domain-containing protein n=1 Tax=Oryza glumipatula TaxID=40148 RepID=A0A0E0BRC4_9ORYZ
MEQSAATAFTKCVVGKLLEVLDTRYKMLRDLSHETASMQNDLLLLAAFMDDQLRRSSSSPAAERPTAVLRAYTKLMRELTHDMEDSIERFLHRVAPRDDHGGAGAPSWPRRATRWVATLRTRLRFAAEIRQLKKRLEDETKRLRNAVEAAAAAGGGGHSSAAPALAAEAPRGGHVEPNPVGMEKPIEHLVQLLDEAGAGGGPQQLRVIAIVGFRGSGKTTLARAVYSRSGRQFRERAWVDASRWTDSGRCASENMMYLIVLDDIGLEQWNAVESIFENNGRGSRVIVTTAILSVANSCTAYKSGANGGCCIRRHGCVYKMQTLGEAHAKELALGGGDQRPPELEHGSATLMAKCDGLPLALVSVANHLRCLGNLTGRHCADLCHLLGSLLLDERNVPRLAGTAAAADSFARLRRVLMDSYAGLPDYAARTCLLYLAVFPNDGRRLKRSVLVRRWLAEGYARGGEDVLGNSTDVDVADGHFRSFIDQNIIVAHPADDDDDNDDHRTRRCRTHGIVHEFVLHKSIAESFIFSSRAPPRRKRVRHLSIQGGGGNTTTAALSTTDLSCVRSLTVFGDGGDAVSNLRKCKLLRVLDLEQCATALSNDHLADICKLWNLRYLSIGMSSNITMLPDKIRRLKLLETIHLSKTKVTMLPLQVVGLPCLAHLVGKFKLLLPDQRGKKTVVISNELEKLAKKSNLQTLAGFVADESQQAFPQLMRHMRKLIKVKIWCEFGGEANGVSTTATDHLADAIRSYIEAPKVEETDARSLSIDMEQCSKQLIRSCHGESKLLHSLKPPCRSYLTSLKLHGDLFRLHGLISMLKNLYELCLSSTTTTLTRDLVSTIGGLPLLLRLKLVANHVEHFAIGAGEFRSLQHLLLVVHRRNPILPKIEEGALPQLVSLELLCKHLRGLSGIQIRHLQRLKEVALDSRVGEDTRREWEAEARRHPNRPSILLLKNRYSTVLSDDTDRLDDQMDGELARDAAATEKSAPDDAAGIQEEIAEVESESSAFQLANATMNNSVTGKESTAHDADEEGLGSTTAD